MFSEPSDIFVSTSGGLWSIKLIGPEFSVTGNGTPEILNKLPLLVGEISINSTPDGCSLKFKYNRIVSSPPRSGLLLILLKY